MSRASDILRERALDIEADAKIIAGCVMVEPPDAAELRHEATEWRAIATLLVVLEASEACPCCLRRYERHEDWCALWAAQRAIEGESARRASEGP